MRFSTVTPAAGGGLNDVYEYYCGHDDNLRKKSRASGVQKCSGKVFSKNMTIVTGEFGSNAVLRRLKSI